MPRTLPYIGIVATGVYLAFLYVYQQFYSQLHLSPEDVGLDRAAILVRTFGAIALLVVFVAYIWMVLLVASLLIWLLVNAFDAAEMALYKLFGQAPKPPHTPDPRRKDVEKHPSAQNFWDFASALGVMGPGAPPPIRSLVARKRLLIAAAVSTLCAVVISIPVLAINAKHAGQDAAMGKTVEPIRFAGLTILDISSVPATVEWTGSGARPSAVAPRTHFLGRTSSTVYLRDATRTVAVPAASVVVSLGE